jgi:hypothetical protein
MGGGIALSTFPEELVQYNYKDLTYTVPDLMAAKKRRHARRQLDKLPKVTLEFKDLPAPAPERFDVTFLDPRYVTLDKPHTSDEVDVIYSIPPDMEARVKQGVHHEVSRTSKGLLRAIANGKDYKFNAGEVFHFKEPTPTGVSDSGWGVPNILWHYDTLHQIQVYRKADAAVATDYMQPFRVFSPELGSNATDASVRVVMANWRREIANMISNRRKDKYAIHALPFPARFDEHGGNGKQYVMHELIEAHVAMLFDGLGFPQELYHGSINIEQMPTAIKMFERQYEWLYHGLNGMLKFVAAKLQAVMDSDELDVYLRRPAIAHNVEAMQLRMQMAANGEIPRDEVYREIGIPDAVEAAGQRMDEDQSIQRMQQEKAVKFEREQTSGSMADITMQAAEQGAAPNGAAGGAPAGAGGAPGSPPDFAVHPGDDPLRINERANQIATQWIQMHAAQPDSHIAQMRQCEAINPTLHAAAKQAMEKMRSQAGSEGRKSVASMVGAPAPG